MTWSYTEKTQHQKLLEKINKCIKFGGYKTAYTSEAFINTNNKLSEKNSMIPFIIASKILRNKFKQGGERYEHQNL